MRRSLLILSALVLSACSQTPVPDAQLTPSATRSVAPVQVWLTTPDQRALLARQSNVEFKTTSQMANWTVRVDPAQTYQQIEGFGAAITESSALVLQGLGETQRQAVLTRLFDHAGGVGFSYVRLPMGASDFARSSYSYNDLPSGESDPTLSRFSIERDEQAMLPLAREALRVNPALRFMASPWSAPAWMKDSGSLHGGRLRTEAHAVYAEYFARYLAAYERAGIRIDALTLQNEPHHETAGYPSMRMEAEQAAVFIKQHLGPTLERQAPGTKLLGWDHNWDEPQYPLALLADKEARAYLSGSAFHCYAGDKAAQNTVHDAHPDKDIYFTECSGGGWATDFGANLKWNMEHLVIGATRNWAKTVLLWNLALDDQHGPRNGGCQNCRGVVTVGHGGQVAYNVEYYALGHASKFVRPGARRVASSSYGSGSLQSVAFLNPDGSRVLLLLNGSNATMKLQVREGPAAFAYSLAAGAVVTFSWPAS